MKKSGNTKSTISNPSKPTASRAKATEKGFPVWPFLAGIVLLVFVLYGNSLRNDILTFDDNEYFQNYPEVLTLSWESVKTYFTSYYVIMYQPLPVLTFAINYHFSGLDTFPMHLLNLLFHLGNVVLVFAFVQKLTSNKIMALLIALAFGIHPMNVEAVSWISARSSGMYTFFFLAGMYFYLRYIREDKYSMLLATGILFILSLFSKAQAVTFPVVLLLLDFVSDRKLLSKQVIVEKIPFCLLSLLFGIITLMNSGTMHNITKGMLIHYNAIDIFFMVCYSFSFYLLKLLLPLKLCAIYVFPPKSGGMLPWEYYASAVLIGAVLYGLWRARSNKWILFGAAFFVATISINIQLIPSRLFIVTDRYGYLPYLGLMLLVGYLITGNTFNFHKYKSGLIVVFTGLMLFFAFSVPARNKIWNNDVVFLTDVIEKNPESTYLYRAYGNRGMAHQVKRNYPEAIKNFDEAIRLKPDDARNYLNRGLSYSFMNNGKMAEADFSRAIALDSTQVMIYNNRSQVRFQLGDYAGAEADSRKCIELDPNSTDAYNTLANVAYMKKQYDEVLALLSKAIEIDPNFAIGYKNRGLVYLELNNKTAACSDFIAGSNLGNQEAKQLQQQHCR